MARTPSVIEAEGLLAQARAAILAEEGSNEQLVSALCFEEQLIPLLTEQESDAWTDIVMDAAIKESIRAGLAFVNLTTEESL